MLAQTAYNALPGKVRGKLDSLLDGIEIARHVKNPRVLAGLAPSAARGFLEQRGRSEGIISMKSGHSATFDFSYRHDFPEMYELYRRAKENQWNGETDLDWSTDVDPYNRQYDLLPDDFFPLQPLEERGIRLSAREQQEFKYCMATWMLSQFLHGEHGALLAAAQVTESVLWTDGKFYGATQVMDEGRHVEVMHRYLETKLNKMYVCNDNLFTIIDALMTDSRWDMKFLGMQIMIEGLALGAFGVLYRRTREPLLKEMLKYVIQDEARHVHYGVLALNTYFKELSEKERREREDWAFEVALLMRNRFQGHEIYEEWFEHKISRKEWDKVIGQCPGMVDYRDVMFKRLIPNLRYIGLLSPRMEKRYADVGLIKYLHGKNASEISAEEMLNDLAN